MRISPRSIEAVRETADIVQVAAEFTALKRQGTNYTGLCPFHSENTPSFSVSSGKGFYYCFGCGAGGDAIKLVSELKSLTFTESVAYLAERFGVELEFEGRSPEETQIAQKRRDTYRVLAAAAAYYHKYLLSAESARHALSYLEGRGLNPRTIEVFRIGYAPPGGGFLKASRRINLDPGALDTAGLMSSGGRERFSGRITFPISDHRGRIIGFGARALGDDKPKYLNSPETDLFNKRHLLYGLPQAADTIRREEMAIVVEGYTDVLMLHQAGVQNAIATLGTAVTENHLRRLSSFTDRLYLLFDPDEAGEKAIERTAAVAASMKLDLRVLRLEKDPADWLLEHPVEEFRELLSQAIPVLEYSIRRIVERTRGADAVNRARALPEVERLIKEISDPVLRREAVRLASGALKVSPQSFRSLTQPARSGYDEHRTSRDPDPLIQAERDVLTVALTRPDLVQGILRDGVHISTLPNPLQFVPGDFSDEGHVRLFSILKEYAGADLNTVLADERVRPCQDLMASLIMEGEKLLITPASAKEAWLRLAVLQREDAKRRCSDESAWMSLHGEVQAIKEALTSLRTEMLLESKIE